MGRKLFFLMLFVLLVGAVTEVFGATYYVATTGLDSNPGTFSQPWLTIGKAASVMVAGDTTYIRGGTYNITSAITPTNSGSAGNYITFSAYQNETPIIYGKCTGYRVFLLTSAHSYFRFVGLTIRNSSSAGGIGVTRNTADYPHHIEIRNCTMQDYTGSSCVKVWGGHDIIFAGCTFLHSKQGIELAVAVGETGGEHKGMIYNIQILDCKFSGMSWDGVVSKADYGYDANNIPIWHLWCEDVYVAGCEAYNCIDDGFDLRGRRTTFENCVAHDINTLSNYIDNHGFKFYALDIPVGANEYHAEFIRCLTYKNAREGYKLSSILDNKTGGSRLYVKKFRMLNCTAANDDYGISLVTNDIHPMDVTIKNSIISSKKRAWEITGNPVIWITLGEPQVKSLTDWLTLDTDYNLWYADGNDPIIYNGTLYNLTSWQSFSGVDGNSISQGPVFDLNYHPTNAACIDSGVDIGFPYAGAAPDMGFYESGTVEVNCPANYLKTGENWISIPVAAGNDGPYSVFKELGTWPNTVYHNLYRYDSNTAGFIKYPTYQSDAVQFGKIVPGGAYKLALDANVATIHVSGIELRGTQELVIGGSGTRQFYFGNPFNKLLYKSHCRIKNGGSEVSIEQAITNGWIGNVEHFNPGTKTWEAGVNMFERWHAYRLTAYTAGELQLIIYDLPLGDLEGDGDVDWADLGLMAENWLVNNCNNKPVGNLDDDCDVDFRDYAIFAQNWSE